jgi:hypothetical protein
MFFLDLTVEWGKTAEDQAIQTSITSGHWERKNRGQNAAR